jgi:hypothetical protein
MDNNKIKYCLIFLMLAFNSCQSNAIYFDIKEQAIKSCNQKGISRIYIKNDSSAETYSLVWSDTTISAPIKIELFNPNNAYKIYKGWNNLPISVQDFKLKTSSSYTIERVQGDASAYKVQVWVDNVGNINKAISESCKN